MAAPDERASTKKWLPVEANPDIMNQDFFLRDGLFQNMANILPEKRWRIIVSKGSTNENTESYTIESMIYQLHTQENKRADEGRWPYK